MKAVIMAGGAGTRLRPLTSNTPKPMLPIANVPMMEHIIRLCTRHGIGDFVVTVQFLAGSIQKYFGDGADFAVSLAYAVEESPLGTAGSVGNARDLLREPFLVISGDALCDFDLGVVLRAHEESGSIATIVLYNAENPLEFGIVITREDGSVERFLEKPTWGQVFSDTVNTGIYVLDPAVFDLIPPGEVVDFSQDVFPGLLAAGETVNGHVAEGYWEDVGTIEAFMKAQRDVLDGRVDVEIPGFEVSDGVWQGEGVELGSDVRVEGPALIGRNCRIRSGTRIREYSVIGDNVVVGEDSILTRTLVFDNAYIGRQVQSRGGIIGKGADVREHARLEPDVVVGDGCSIGAGAVLNPAVRVYPFKRVEPAAIVNTSVVWESRAARSLFGRRGVRGIANVDITPELAVRLAMAYASTLDKDATVTCSRNASRAARALKRAFMAGLNAAGVSVDDLEIATVPLTRFQAARTSGGVTLRADPSEPEIIEIRFFDRDGIDLAEAAQRKIERNFDREDYRRALHDEMGEILYPPRVPEFYANGLVRGVDAASITAARLKVVLDYAYGTASLLLPEVLARVEADVLAINPYTTERTRTFHPEVDLARLGELVRTSGSAFGMAFDDAAETAVLVDDFGRTVPPTQAMLLYVQLMSEAHAGGTIVLPVDASVHAERIALAAGCTVVWSQTSAPALMAAATADEVVLAVDGTGLIVPRFQSGYDAVAQCLLTMELVARRAHRLSSRIDALPPVHMARDVVPTPWERKGAVMRTLVEQADPDRAVLIDGVKITGLAGPGSWGLVLPDPEEPVSHVTAEAGSDDAARTILTDLRKRIDAVVHE